MSRMNHARRRLLVSGFALLAGAQAPRPAVVIPAEEMTFSAAPYVPAFVLHAQSRLVEVPVVVRDSDHKAIGGLDRDDFHLTVDGKPEAITGFSEIRASADDAHRGAPTVVWFFDDLNANLAELGVSARGARKVLDRGLAPGQRLGVYTSSGDNQQPLTTDLARVKASMDSLEPIVRVFADPTDKRKIMLADVGNLVKYLCPLHGDRTLVLVADAVSGGTAEWQPVINSALDCGVHVSVARPVCFLGPFGCPLNSTGGGVGNAPIRRNAPSATAPEAKTDGDEPPAHDPIVAQPHAHEEIDSAHLTPWILAAADMADATGGQVLDYPADADVIFRAYSSAPETSYLLSFAPDLPADGAGHHIKVHVSTKGPIEVQARQEFLAPAPPAVANATLDVQGQLMKAVTETEAQAAVGFTVTPSAAAAPGANGLVDVQVDFALDPQTLGWKHAHGSNNDGVILIAALLTPDGHYVIGERGDLVLQLKDKTLAALRQPGAEVPATLKVRVSPGTYRLRTLVRDSNGGTLGAATQEFAVRGGQ